MKKGDKALMIDELKEKFANNPFFISLTHLHLLLRPSINSERICFEKGIEVHVVKIPSPKRLWSLMLRKRTM